MAEYEEDEEHGEDCGCGECAQDDAREAQAEDERIRGNRALQAQAEPGKIAALVKALRKSPVAPPHGSVQSHGALGYGALDRDGVKLFDDGVGY